MLKNINGFSRVEPTTTTLGGGERLTP